MCTIGSGLRVLSFIDISGYIHTYIHTYIHMYIYIYTHMYIDISAFIDLLVFLFACISIHLCDCQFLYLVKVCVERFDGKLYDEI